MADVTACPYCGDMIPTVLLAAHAEACDENPGTDSAGALLIRPDEEPDTDATPTDKSDFDAEFERLRSLKPETGVDPFDLADMPDDPSLRFESDQDIDDEFMKLVGQLDINPGVAEVSVAVLTDTDLSSRFSEVKQELLKRGEMINATTQIGRDLQSQRAAYLIELRRRGLA